MGLPNAKLVESRSGDELRTDRTFVPLYIRNNRSRFVSLENAIALNQRLTLQQGIFTCPGYVGTHLVSNLQAMPGWDHEENLVQLRLELVPAAAREFASKLKAMNVSSAVLFPGLDGFARSLRELMFLYERQAQDKIGCPVGLKRSVRRRAAARRR
jgi:hypothetical protein